MALILPCLTGYNFLMAKQRLDLLLVERGLADDFGSGAAGWDTAQLPALWETGIAHHGYRPGGRHGVFGEKTEGQYLAPCYNQF